MDKSSVSRRNDALKAVDDQMRMAGQRREELSKEMAELDQLRNDLAAALDIVSHQFQSLQQVLERANAPKVEGADYDTMARERPMTTATRAGNW